MNPGRRIGFYNTAGLFKTAYLKAATMEKGISGFSASGIFPLLVFVIFSTSLLI